MLMFWVVSVHWSVLFGVIMWLFQKMNIPIIDTCSPWCFRPPGSTSNVLYGHCCVYAVNKCVECVRSRFVPWFFLNHHLLLWRCLTCPRSCLLRDWSSLVLRGHALLQTLPSLDFHCSKVVHEQPPICQCSD